MPAVFLGGRAEPTLCRQPLLCLGKRGFSDPAAMNGDSALRLLSWFVSVFHAVHFNSQAVLFLLAWDVSCQAVFTQAVSTSLGDS